MDITIETTIAAPIEKVWAEWNDPEHIVRWNFASEDWQCPRADINLTVGGKFKYRMEAKDGAVGFDFAGTFTSIDPGRKIHYTLDDDRKVIVSFEQSEKGVVVVQTFEAESELQADQQRQGWQGILNNFKAHVEANGT